MWHEARKQERKIRGIMVDYKKRAERRREFYEKIKQDPTQFLRLHGMPCKINLDPAVAIAAEGPGTMMPWQGDSRNMIDRFDARAHLDYIPETSVVDVVSNKGTTDKEEHKCNYERYRTLVQNECAGIMEEKCLQQITEDEMFPEIGLQKKANEAKEKLMGKKAAIGFTYEDKTNAEPEEDEKAEEIGLGLLDSDSDSSDSLSDLDIDINVDVDELDDEQRTAMNECAVRFGMAPGEYVRMLEKDKEEIEMLKRAKEEEEEKAMYSGRKSRRERRAFIEKKLRERRDTQPSPPSYARRNSPTYQPYQRRSHSHSSSRSRSTTPEDTGRVTFITSFGEDEAASERDATATAVTSSSKKSSDIQSWTTPKKRSRSNSSSSSSSSRSRSRSQSKERRRNSRSRSKSRSRSRSRSSSRDGHRQRLDRGGRYGRSNRRYSSSRSRSRSPAKGGYRRSRSRSHERRKDSRSRSRSRSRSKSRSPPSRYTRPRSPDQYRARSRSRTPDRVPGNKVGSQYNINAKLKKPEFGLSKAVGSADKPKLTPQQRLKLRMQKALTKQHKADKVKEKEKKATKRQERQNREDELREMSRKMRRREREKRDREREELERERSRKDRSRSSSSSPERRRKYSRRYSRSRSRSRSRSTSPSRSRSISPPPRSRYHRD